MGGYASFPVCFAGMILKIPFVIYENNLLIGKANRYLAPFAKKILVSYKDIQGISEKYKSKITITGNILRENIYNIFYFWLTKLGVFFFKLFTNKLIVF